MIIIRPTTITNSIFVSSNVTEADYSEWNSGVSYLVDEYAIVIGDYHKVYQSLQSGNVGNYPPDNLLGSPPWWLEVSSTNRWKMFDGYIESQTVNTSFIEVSLLPGEIDSIVFLNVDASFISVVMTDPIAGIVYNEDIQLVAAEKVQWEVGTDWESGRVWQGGDSDLEERVAIKLDLPSYPNAILKITIAGAGGTAKCGAMIIGTQRDIGDTKYSPTIGITDYSVKTTDAFGNYTVEERAFSKKIDCTFMVETVDHPEILRLLALYRSVPLVWVPSDLFNTTIIYGFYKDFSMNVNTMLTECNINIEGLV